MFTSSFKPYGSHVHIFLQAVWIPCSHLPSSRMDPMFTSSFKPYGSHVHIFLQAVWIPCSHLPSSRMDPILLRRRVSSSEDLIVRWRYGVKRWLTGSLRQTMTVRQAVTVRLTYSQARLQTKTVTQAMVRLTVRYAKRRGRSRWPRCAHQGSRVLLNLLQINRDVHTKAVGFCWTCFKPTEMCSPRQ